MESLINKRIVEGPSEGRVAATCPVPSFRPTKGAKLVAAARVQFGRSRSKCRELLSQCGEDRDGLRHSHKREAERGEQEAGQPSLSHLRFPSCPRKKSFSFCAWLRRIVDLLSPFHRNLEKEDEYGLCPLFPFEVSLPSGLSLRVEDKVEPSRSQWMIF